MSDRYERAEQLERIRERVKAIVDNLTKWETCTYAAIKDAKASLEKYREYLKNIKG